MHPWGDLGVESWLKSDYFGHFWLVLADLLPIKFAQNGGDRSCVSEQLCR
jgi:hypothetical protein